MDRMFRVNGIDLHARIDGPDGAPWLVLSNSLGATLEMWEPQVAAFSREFRVLRYDTRGHGKSAVPPGPYTIDQLGSDVVGLLDTLGIARAHFCGLSMGGATGMWLAVHASARIDRLVLCNTTPWLGPPEVMDARIATIRREGMAALVEGIIQRWFTADAITRHAVTVERIRQTLLQDPGGRLHRLLRGPAGHGSARGPGAHHGADARHRGHVRSRTDARGGAGVGVDDPECAVPRVADGAPVEHRRGGGVQSASTHLPAR